MAAAAMYFSTVATSLAFSTDMAILMALPRTNTESYVEYS